MTERSVFCIANCRPMAEMIVDQLRFYKIARTGISILFSDTWMSSAMIPSQNGIYDGQNAEEPGANTGAAMPGGTLGWIAGIGALAFPGVGTFIAAGPVKDLLSDAAAAEIHAGGIGDSLKGLGLPGRQAKQFEDRIRLGNIMISVHTGSLEESMQAKFIFTRARAMEVCMIDGHSLPEEKQTWDDSSQRTPAGFSTFLPDLFSLPGRGQPSLMHLSSVEPTESPNHRYQT